MEVSGKGISFKIEASRTEIIFNQRSLGKEFLLKQRSLGKGFLSKQKTLGKEFLSKQRSLGKEFLLKQRSLGKEFLFKIEVQDFLQKQRSPGKEFLFIRCPGKKVHLKQRSLFPGGQDRISFKMEVSRTEFLLNPRLRVGLTQIVNIFQPAWGKKCENPGWQKRAPSRNVASAQRAYPESYRQLIVARMSATAASITVQSPEVLISCILHELLQSPRVFQIVSTCSCNLHTSSALHFLGAFNMAKNSAFQYTSFI